VRTGKLLFRVEWDKDVEHHEVTGRIHKLLCDHDQNKLVSVPWEDLQYINECAAESEEADEIRHKAHMAELDKLRGLLGLDPDE